MELCPGGSCAQVARPTIARTCAIGIGCRVCPPPLLPDVGAAASPVRPASGRSLAPGRGAPLPWRRSAYNKAEQGQDRRMCAVGASDTSSAVRQCRPRNASRRDSAHRHGGAPATAGRCGKKWPAAWDPAHLSANRIGAGHSSRFSSKRRAMRRGTAHVIVEIFEHAPRSPLWARMALRAAPLLDEHVAEARRTRPADHR